MDKEKILKSIYKEHSYVMRLLRVMGVDENDVEDLAEDVFVAAFKHIGGLRDKKRLHTWIGAIAANKARKYFGNKRKIKEESNVMRIETGEIDIYDFIADELTVEKIMQTAEEKAVIEKMMDNLPEVAKRVMRLRFWGDYKFTEIAEIMELNVNTVKSIYRRNIKRLRFDYNILRRENEDE